jgi:hypothetical protein
MSDITINPANGNISVNLSVTTPQVVGYEVTVYDTDGNTPLEHYLSDSQTNNPFRPALAQPAGAYTGRYVGVVLSIIDPVGAGNNYSIDFSLRQQGADLNPVQHITGVTATGKLNRFAIFHLQ